METLARISDRMSQLVVAIGKLAKWLIVPLIAITIWDVITRKFITLQLFISSFAGGVLNSTMLQEMEWHLHTALFALCLGFGYIHNSHVRVDLISEGLKPRIRAWIEFFGCLLFMIPYTAVVIYFAYEFAVTSYVQHEISASMIGIPNRWIIKSVFLIGMILALLAGLSILLRYVLVLFGPRHLARDPFLRQGSKEPVAEI
jgi:TRAP-type mannitol/chloroaromatic compound transport system permease small subunit